MISIFGIYLRVHHHDATLFSDMAITWVLQMGVSIAARNYELNTETPFQTSDFLNLQPVVKHSVPVCSQARDLMESGKTRLAEVGKIFI